MPEAAIWLNKADKVATASNADLRRSLLTADGRGAQFKEMCLDELLKRAESGARHG